MPYGYQCGMLWGATLAAGARAYRVFGPGPRAETMAIVAAQRLVSSFRALNGNINCLEITGLDRSSSTLQMLTFFLLKGGCIGCFRKVTRYAREAFSEIGDALAGSQSGTPPPPVSCAAVLSRKTGLSDMRTVMTAGLAGGIGLCGGACGALGAAIWTITLSSIERGTGKFDYNDPAASEALNRFLKITDYEFDCSEIAGRRFESVADHADYLRGGGCSEIIDLLASTCSPG